MKILTEITVYDKYYCIGTNNIFHLDKFVREKRVLDHCVLSSTQTTVNNGSLTVINTYVLTKRYGIYLMLNTPEERAANFEYHKQFLNRELYEKIGKTNELPIFLIDDPYGYDKLLENIPWFFDVIDIIYKNTKLD